MPSQMHEPPMQRWPAAQAGPLPQRHAPPVHVDAVMPHATHDAPAVPHAIAVPGEMHVVPEQQPLGHELGVQPLHTPAEHVPTPHEVQAAPPVPHAPGLVPGTHVVPWQQPLGHEVGSHVHAPPTHRCPVTHAGPAPHAHPPLAEQPSPSPLLAQSTHVVPFGPHVEVARGTHAPPSQHPDVHEVASHTQAPPMHRCPGSQAGPAPHAHAPAVQRSAVRSHAKHAFPPAPHAPVPGT